MCFGISRAQRKIPERTHYAHLVQSNHRNDRRLDRIANPGRPADRHWRCRRVTLEEMAQEESHLGYTRSVAHRLNRGFTLMAFFEEGMWVDESYGSDRARPNPIFGVESQEC